MMSVADLGAFLDQLEYHLLADVWGMRPPGVAQVGLIAELKVDDLDARRSGRRQQPLVCRDDQADAGFVDACPKVEHSALRGIGVLHVDHDDRGPSDVNFDVIGFRMKRDHCAAALAATLICQSHLLRLERRWRVTC